MESFEGLAVLRELFIQEFQGDESAKTGILGLIDDTHTPTTESFEDAIVRDGFSNHGHVALIRSRTLPLFILVGANSIYVQRNSKRRTGGPGGRGGEFSFLEESLECSIAYNCAQ